jgi:hypothetical protein
MRILIRFDNGQPHDLGVTHAYVQELLNAKVQTPDEILTIRNARIHMTASTASTATLRAGKITSIEEIP